MILMPLAVSLVLFLCAVVLSFQKRPESIVSLIVGSAACLGFGVQEMWIAVGLAADDATRMIHVVASLAFTTSAALFVRLAVRQIRGRRATA